MSPSATPNTSRHEWKPEWDMEMVDETLVTICDQCMLNLENDPDQRQHAQPDTVIDMDATTDYVHDYSTDTSGVFEF
jgi:hypothetical protein